jgi:phage-related protein (TIGR01555 family)
MACTHTTVRSLTGGTCPLCPAPRKSARGDDYVNVLSGAGTSSDRRSYDSYRADVVPIEEAALLWRTEDMAAKIIEAYADEMLRAGFELRVRESADKQRDAKEICETLHSKWEELGLTSALWDAISYERAYGGAAILLGVNDMQSSWALPLNLKTVVSLDFLTVLQPDELIPETYYEDATASKYGQVELWRLRPHGVGRVGVGSEQLIHESRLIIFPGIRVSRKRGDQPYEGWGDSVLSRVRRVLFDFGMGWSAAGYLMRDFAQGVYKMKDFDIMAAENNTTAVKARLQALEMGRSFSRIVVVDKEDEFVRQQTPISGMPEMLDRFAIRIAAAGDIPVTRLMGQSPAGLNATGNADIRFWYDKISGLQDRKLRPRLEYIALVTFAALKIKEPEHWSFRFRPLWQETAKETADARMVQAQADAIYITNCVLSAEEVALARFGGDEYNYDTPVDFEARAKLEPAADAPVKSQRELDEEEAERELAAQQLEASAAEAPSEPSESANQDEQYAEPDAPKKKRKRKPRSEE